MSRLHNTQDQVQATAVCDNGSSVFLGDSLGQLHLIKNLALSFPKNELPINILQSRFCQARTYACQASAITEMHTDFREEFLLTVSELDECVMQWSIKKCIPNWEYDHLPYDEPHAASRLREAEQVQADLEDRIQAQLQSLEQRLLISEMKTKTDDEDAQKKSTLLLLRVIGRKSFSAKNNLFVSADSYLIAVVGSLLVMQPLPLLGETQVRPDERFRQLVLEPDSENTYSESPEIASLAICHNNKYLGIGTKQISPVLMLWDITTTTFVQKTQFFDCVSVLNIRFSEDYSKTVCLTQQKSLRQAVYLLEMFTGTMLAFCVFENSDFSRIKDLAFLPHSNSQFLSCGTQHLSLWEFRGGLLNFEEMELVRFNDQMATVKAEELLDRVDPSRISSRVELRDEILQIKTAFLALVFVKRFAILAAEDSHLYVWKDRAIIQAKKAHPNATVTCLDFCSELNKVNRDLRSRLMSRLLRFGSQRRNRAPLGTPEFSCR